jgi:hypothetical protein
MTGMEVILTTASSFRARHKSSVRAYRTLARSISQPRIKSRPLPRLSPNPPPPRRPPAMPSATIEPRQLSPLATMTMYDRQRDASAFDDNPYFIQPDPDQMLFDIEDVSYHMNDPSTSSYPWASAFPASAPIPDLDPKPSPGFGLHYEYAHAQASPTDSFYDSPFYNTPDTSAGSPSAAFDSNLYLQWPSEVSPSSPIPIPASPITVEPQHSQSFVSFADSSAHFPDQSTFSPTEFAALHPLPQSSPLSTSFEDRMARARVDSNSSSVQSMDLSDGPLMVPAWASQLFDGKNPVPSSSSMAMSPRRPSPLGGGGADSHSHPSSHSHRRHISIPTSGTGGAATNSGRRGSIPSLYHSAGSPPFSPQSAPTSSMLRSYSRKAEPPSNFGGNGGGGNSTLAEDRDATVRRRRKISAPEQPEGSEKATESREYYYPFHCHCYCAKFFKTHCSLVYFYCCLFLLSLSFFFHFVF